MVFNRKTVALATIVVGLSSGTLLAAGGSAGRLHVMWGNEGVDLARTTAERRVHRLAYDRDILKFDAPWEGDGCCNPCFIVDEDEKGTLYRLYYVCWSLRRQAGRRGAGGLHGKP